MARQTVAFLKIEGIPGAAIKKGFEEQISVVGYEHSIVRSLAAMHEGSIELQHRSTLVTRMGNPREAHKPFVIFKSMDRATPLIMQALQHSKVLKDPVELSILQSVQPGSSGGGELVSMKIALSGAVVQGVEYSEMGGEGTFERVSFAYNKIEWTFQGMDEAGKKSGVVSFQADLETLK
jgi:type VI secretion system Hcp family effector